MGRRHQSTGTAETAEFTLPVAFQTYECDGPPTTVTATKQELLADDKEMVLVRRLETAADGLYKAKMIRGFCHLCTGQVWICAGAGAGARCPSAYLLIPPHSSPPPSLLHHIPPHPTTPNDTQRQ